MHDKHILPSDWLCRWGCLLPPSSTVLDVACGTGRHMKWLNEHGHTVVGIDRAPESAVIARQWGTVLEADIENGPWPLFDESPAVSAYQQFDAVVVFNYLWRPLWPALLGSIKPGGLLIYETFATGNEAYGRPTRPDFLLREGELLNVCNGHHIVAYEHVLLQKPQRVVQRIVSRQA